MPNKTHEARIQCPYYLRLGYNGRTVMCEGLAPGSEIVIRFPGGGERDEWLSAVCETRGYAEDCLLAKAIEGKYESFA